MTKLARVRNRSALKWSLATIGVWIATEIVVSILITIGFVISMLTLGTPKSLDNVPWLAYLPALLAALISAELMIRRLRSLPTLPADESFTSYE